MKNILNTLVLIGLLGSATHIIAADTNSPLAVKLQEQAKASSDPQLASITSDFTSKLQAYAASLGNNPAIKTKLDDILKSLTGGKDSAALTSAYKLTTGAKLTSEQTNLAKQIGNLASAFTVQKNFASLEGSQSDVASVVASLRKGELTNLVTPLQNIGKNAKLTPGQKELFGTLMDNYAPGLKKAADSIKNVKIPGL